VPITLIQYAEEQLSLKGAIVSKRAKAKPKIQSMNKMNTIELLHKQH